MWASVKQKDAIIWQVSFVAIHMCYHVLAFTLPDMRATTTELYRLCFLFCPSFRGLFPSYVISHKDGR